MNGNHAWFRLTYALPYVTQESLMAGERCTQHLSAPTSMTSSRNVRCTRASCDTSVDTIDCGLSASGVCDAMPIFTTRFQSCSTKRAPSSKATSARRLVETPLWMTTFASPATIV